MKNIIAFCVRRPVTVLMLFLALLIFGVVSVFNLPMEFLPSIAVPKLIVSASYPGLPPAEIRELITIPLEDSLSSLQGIRTISSVSRQGGAVIELEFHWGKEMKIAAVETREIIDIAWSTLPAETEKPLVLPVRPGEEPVIVLGIFPKRGDLALVRRIAEDEISTALQQVEGTGSVILAGGAEEEVQILVDQDRAAQFGFSLTAIHQAVQASNIAYPAGSLIEGAVEYAVKTDARLTSVDALASLPIPAEGGPVPLSAIAEVRPAYKEQDSCFLSGGSSPERDDINTIEGIGLFIRRQAGHSPVSLSRSIRREVAGLGTTYSADCDIRILEDRSKFITRSVRDLFISALLGIAAAFVIIMLFVKNTGSALIVTVSFPVSILFALLFLNLTGRSLNIMSLGGVVIGIGMLVDNAIVMTENLRIRVPRKTENFREDIIAAAVEMAGSTFGSTMTTLIVFAPVIFLPGIIGALYTDLALAVIFSLIGSWLCSVMLIPVLYMITLKPAGTSKKQRVERVYRKLFLAIFRKPVILVPLLLILLGTGAAGWLFLEFTLIPRINTGEVDVTVHLDPGASMEMIMESGTALSRLTGRIGEVESSWLRAGGEEEDVYYQADPDERRGIIHQKISLRDGAERKTDRVIDELQTILRGSEPDVRIEQPDTIISPLLGISEGETILSVSGDNQESARSRGLTLKERIETLRSDPDGTPVTLLPLGRIPEIRMVPVPDSLSASGLSIQEITRELRTALSGSIPGTLHPEGDERDIRLKLKEGDRKSIKELKRLPILTPSGQPAALGDLVRLIPERNHHALLRENRMDTVRLLVPPGTDVQSLVSEDEYISRKDSPVIRENSIRIGATLLMALVLMYLVLGAQFESFSVPLILFASILFAVCGIFPALAITGSPLSLSSSLGILVLLGIVVNNSIILYETYTRLLSSPFVSSPASGRNLPGSVIFRGSVRRVRPVLMTTLTTVTALIPIAVDPWNSSTQSGMAIAIIGGLAVSTLLTLLVQPFLFCRHFSRRFNLSRRKQGV